MRLFGEDVAVKAKLFTINGFSAHAGQGQLLEWLGHFQTKDMQVFLVHGEFPAQQVLADLIRERFGFKVLIPEYLEESTLKTGEVVRRVEYPEKAAPCIDWGYILEDLDAKLAQIKARRMQMESKPWVEQTEIRDRLLDLNRSLMEINSEI